MSSQSYSKWWIKTNAALENIRFKDELLKQNSKQTKERSIAGNLVGGLYARYCTIIQEMDACLDQMLQVQKGFTVRKLMDAAVVRLNELKEELTKIDISEIHYIDGNLVELKLIPHEVEILYPSLVFPRPPEIDEMWEKIKKGETIYVPPPPPTEEELAALAATATFTKTNIDPILGLLAAPPPPPVAAKESEIVPEVVQPAEELPEPEPAKEEKDVKKRIRKPKMFVKEEKILTPEELEAIRQKEILKNALTSIQTHERARQCRNYYHDLDNLRIQRKANIGKKVESPDPEVLNAAATQIEKCWKGHAVRKEMRLKERERRLLIGMTEPSWRSHEEKEKFHKTIEQRRELRYQHIRDYIKANLDEKDRVLRVIGPGLMEDIGDEIREWFRFWYDSIRVFDKFPDEEKGGTILVVRGETMTPKEWLDEVERRRKAKKKGNKDKKKEKEAKEKAKKAAADKKKKEKEKAKREAKLARKREMKGEFEFQMSDSVAKERFKAGFKEQRVLWNDKSFEDNPTDDPYMDIITDQKCYEMQLELRKNVDELMRIELDLLNDALDLDRLKAKKKGRKGKKKKKKKNKKKKKKGKKGKKDPTANRKTEDLFQELVDNGIIHNYPCRNFEEYRGDFSYKNWELRNWDFDPMHTLGDVKQAVILNCCLPLGAEEMIKPKSVLIAGPRKSGKHILANAVFNSTRCVLFDLSAPILAGKYPGKKQLKMLVHLINKMSRLLQPSIIFFDGAEKPFYKKVPKNEKGLEPKRLGGQLLKGIIKPITPQDKVLVLGITSQPWAAKAKKFSKAFEKIILIPRPDYGSVYLYWRELLMSYHGVDRDFNVTTLAKLTVNYPLLDIKETVETIFTPERIIALYHNPLKEIELYELIMRKEPISDKEYNKFIKWYYKTPLGKKKAVFNKVADRKREQEAKQAEKDKAKKRAK